MKYILINGKKRSGKDHIGNMIRDEFAVRGISAEILSFADPIKDIIAQTFNIEDDELDNFKNKSEEIYIKKGNRYQQITNFRKVLQHFGTEAMKSWFGDDVWVQLLTQRANDLEVDYVIVTDFRFEIEQLDDAYTLRIVNSNAEDVQDNHASENELNLFRFDYTLDNSGYCINVDHVERLVDRIMSEE